MKKTFTFLDLVMSLLLLFMIAAGTLQAQNIVGGNNGDPSAILDLQSSEKGLLIPRMTSTERSAIASPAAGLMIYNTTLSCLEVNIGSSSSPDWLCIAGAGKVASIDCSGAVQAGNLVAEAAASGVSVTLTYTGGNGNNYSMQSVGSTGVTGLTASLNAGTLASGSGSLMYTISGTPSAAGTASFALVVGGQTCSLDLSVAPPVGVITALDCAGATLTGSLAASAAASDVSLSVPYSDGNGGTYSAQTINSTGVTGLTATLTAGTFAEGSGSLEYSITGTPAAAGTANFALSIGGQSCTLSISVAPPAGVITALNCAGATITGTLTASDGASGVSASVPYTGANGGTYAAQTVNSTGSTGLTATLAAGVLASGSGSLQFTISGTPATAGTAAFALSIGGQSCTLSLSVAQPAAMITALNCAGATSTGTLTAGVAASGVSSTVPYTGGNGGTYSGQTVNSTGVTGLTATKSAGALASGSGSVVYTITGTPSAGGTANFVINLGGQSCTLSRTVAIPIGTITALNCASATASGTLNSGVAASGVSSSVPYTGGNGGSHNGQTVNSTGVTGLTATLSAGTFAVGSGNLQYTITGTPSAAGTASFALNIGGRNCTLTRTVTLPVGTITALNCSSATATGTLTAGVPANGVSSSVPYTGGNGGTHSGQTVNSTGVTGLTATLTAGTFASGSGNLQYTITGTPSGSGTASFALNIGGRTCTLQRTVVALSACGAFVASGVWKEFQCYNLGAANTSAPPFTPSWELNGNYYQWGRKPTCFGRDGTDGSNPCTSPVYGAAGPWGSTTSNDNAGAISGWSTTAAGNTAWSDASRTTNDPCPTGFKVPSAAQWEGVINASLNPRLNIGTWSSTTTNYSSGVLFGTLLFLPAAGSRDTDNGELLGNRGQWGDYWSSSIDTAAGISRYMALGSNNFTMVTNSRTGGLSVRCVAL